MTALGHVVSELIANSYVHAFPAEAWSISVTLSVDQPGDHATMICSDDGVGFADTGDNKQHGLGLVKRLMEQVRGSATLRSDHGTERTLKFPVPTRPTLGSSIANI